MNDEKTVDIKAIIGLGNPGKKYYHTRHSIGFRVADELAHRYGASWQEKDNMEIAEININGKKLTLVKPQTFMNDSGKVVPYLLKKGIEPENILVVHDELEMPVGKMKTKFGGSARGHNGLRSIMNVIGKEFHRLCFGISRPEKREDVADYVLQVFSQNKEDIEELVIQAADMLEDILGKKRKINIIF